MSCPGTSSPASPSTGLWFEIMLLQMMARYAYDQDPQAAHTQYALTEIGDETRHIIMFAKAIARLGMPDVPAAPARPCQLARVYKATARGVTLVRAGARRRGGHRPAAALDDATTRRSIPLMRMVNRIHVIEEARHVRFAREEVAQLRTGSGPVRAFPGRDQPRRSSLRSS